MSELTPKQVVAELDKYIIGQDDAKREVAIALRNRYRRSLLPEDLKEEVTPKNILMIGPTGVGKTEIARRMAKIVDAPFLKVEATKFTEVGYVGRDVDSIVKDLVDVSIRLVKQQRRESVKEKAEKNAEEELLDLLLQDKSISKKQRDQNFFSMLFQNPNQLPKPATETDEEKQERLSRREQMRRDLRNGLLENEIIEIEVEDNSSGIGIEIAGISPDINMGDMFQGILPQKTKTRKVSVSEGRKILENQEADKLIDMDSVIDSAIYRAEQFGIVFIDEIDKIARKNKATGHGPDVSGEGVQRDILPLVEGCSVNTKYGPVKTDYMLFIGAGAFNVASVDDLIPELQGRFPVHVNLNPLSKEDLKLILTKPENSLIKQYTALLSMDGVNISFTEDALEEIAEYADMANRNVINTGARRLHTIIENVLDEISFHAGDVNPPVDVTIDREYVKQHIKDELKEIDLNKFMI